LYRIDDDIIKELYDRTYCISRSIEHSPDKFSALISVHAKCIQFLIGSIFVLYEHNIVERMRKHINNRSNANLL